MATGTYWKLVDTTLYFRGTPQDDYTEYLGGNFDDIVI